MSQELPAMTEDELRDFVVGVVDGKIFILQDIPTDRWAQLASSVFMILALAQPEQLPDLKNVGTIWEYLDQAGPRSVNGYPMFTSCRFMSKADWEKARPALLKLMEKRTAEKQAITFDQDGPVKDDR